VYFATEPASAFDAAIEAEITANPPNFEEFLLLCEQGKALGLEPDRYNADEAFDEAGKQAVGAEAAEYSRKAHRIRYYLNHRELWDETTRITREQRDEWNDPREKVAGLG
jgi:hypothetical protein